MANNGQRTRVINSARRQRAAMIESAAEVAPTVQGEAASIGRAVEAGSVIWTVRLKTGRAVIFRASGSRAFRAAALIALVAAADSAVIASVAAGDLVAAALADSAAVAGSGADAEN